MVLSSVMVVFAVGVDDAPEADRDGEAGEAQQSVPGA
jgi:hypothetical protein